MKVKSIENTLNGKGIAIQKSKKIVSTILNTDNKTNFSFTYEGLEIQILGGLNDDKLDSLRVTLKINKTDSYHAIRHTVNLFSHTQVEKFINTLSYRLEISDVTIRKAFLKLVSELETYRMANLSQEIEETPLGYDLPTEEKEEAETLLKSKDLLEKTNGLIGGSGIVGEENNRLLMYLIFTSRKTLNPLHCISFGASGSGKTHLQSKVANLIPNEDKIEFTQLSANAFYYFKQHELKHKLILIEDLDGAEDGLLPLRELQTKKRISKSIVHKGIGGIGKTKHLIVEGPVSVSGCTTKERVYEDNSNRSFLLYIDESSAQDERIMSYQRMQSAGRIDEENELVSAKLLRNVQRLLKPIRVINPFAEYLELPKTVFKPRRTNMHYLQLIEAITFYHQYQREEKFSEVTGEAYVETTLEDIKLANSLIKDVLLRKSDQLNGVTRDYLNRLITLLKGTKETRFSASKVRAELRVKESTQRRYHKTLIAEGFLIRSSNKDGQSFMFEISDVDDFKALEDTIEKALQLCLENVSSPQARHN